MDIEILSNQDKLKRKRAYSLNDIIEVKKKIQEKLKVVKNTKHRFSRPNIAVYSRNRQKKEGKTSGVSRRNLKQKEEEEINIHIYLTVIFKLINLIKKNQTTNFDYKPSYISAIKTGTDLLYQNDINIKKERLVEIFLNDIDKKFKRVVQDRMEGVDEDQEELLINNFIKCSLLLLDIDDINFDIKDDKKKLTSSTSGGFKKKNKKIKGGAFDFLPSTLIENFLKYQYIFDNYHDFNDFKEIPDEYFYKATDIGEAELQKLYGLREPIIFNKIITKSPDILDKILYFSIYNFVNYTKEVDEILGKIMVKDQKDIDLMKTNIEQFLKDIMGVKEIDYVVDMKLNFGNISLLNKFSDKILSLGVISNITNLLNESSNWELIKNQIIELFDKKRFYTLEDIYDSAPIDCKNKALNFLNEMNDNSINALGYISHLIFGNEDFQGSLNALNIYIDIFKAFKKNIRNAFEVVYYKDENNNYRVALIFKNEEFFRNIRLDDTKKYFFKLKVSLRHIYIYIKDIDGGDYYAIDICENRKSVFEIKNVVKMIKKLTTINKISEIRLTDLNNIISSYVAFCINPNFDGLLTKENKIDITRAYFDLKKSGDIARILFVFFYNYLKKNNIENNTLKHITNDICYTGNDKLADLNSIIRKGNNVIFPDTANYSICLFNINNKDYSFKDFYISVNTYFISKFISNKLDIFQKIYENEFIDNDIKKINNIIRNISYDTILLLKDNIDNTDKIYEDVKKNIKGDFEKFIISLKNSSLNFKDILIKILSECKDYILDPSIQSKVDELLGKVTRVTETSDIEIIANQIKLTYTDCNYNHKEIENDLLDKLEKLKKSIGELKTINQNLNNITYTYTYIKILHFLTLLNDISKYDKDTFKKSLNGNMKYILIQYLIHISVNIKENLENENVIKYYNENVIFNKVEINDNNREIFLNITNRVLNNIKNNNNKIIVRFQEIIQEIDDTEFKLLLPEKLKEIFLTIHNYLKIIDTFVFYIPSKEIDNPNPSNIHECITNFNKYIFDLLAYKKNYSKQDRFKVNFYNLINNPTILSTIFNFDSASGLSLNGLSTRTYHLIKYFFKNIDNINYVIFFNNFYDLFDIIEKKNKLLNVDIFFDSSQNLIKKIISQIKSIYTYSYINIYNTANEKKYFELFFENIKTILDERTSSILDKLRRNLSQNQAKIDYFEKVIEKLKNSIETNKANFIILDKKMKTRQIIEGHDLESIAYLLDLTDNIHEKIDYDYKVKVEIQDDISRTIKISIENEELNEIEIKETYPEEIKKIIKIFNFFLSFN